MGKSEEESLNLEELSELLGEHVLKGSMEESDLSEYPQRLAIFPIVKAPYLPSMSVPMMVESGKFLDILKHLVKMDQKFIGLVLTRNKDQNIYDAEFQDLHEVGVIARIIRMLPIQDAGVQVILNIERRFRIESQVKKKNSRMLIAKVTYHSDQIPKQQENMVTAYTSNIILTVKDLLAMNPVYKEELQIFASHADYSKAGKVADFAVALTTASREDLQDVLSTFDVAERCQKALVFLKKEVDINKLQQTINMQIESTISQTQREFFLKEQLKAIQKELGMKKDDKQMDIEKFEERIKDLILSEEALKVYDEEIEKLSVLDPQSAEYAIVRSYLDWITVLPWGKITEDNDSLELASKILDEDHYGLEDVKERIIEHISVGILNKGVRGQIICLVGPPGVGKTSLGKSIARALDRKFTRFSVGGMRDEAEIKGHRRTYVGAMPGKLIQGLKYTGTSNPVIMIDEVDKMSSSHHFGDPSSAVLEVLDPEQNQEFQDHYLDVRFDLSNVLFILTANSTDSIPDPLLDRLEVIRLSGYIESEKLQIAKRYLLPKHLKEVGLRNVDVLVKSEALHRIINEYCRESGVRNLEKKINRILRKVATKKVREMEKKNLKKLPNSRLEVTKANLEEYLGKPVFTSERYFGDKDQAGVATGLAWTSMGGSILYIESVSNHAKDRGLRITGNLGDVMKESSTIAWTYLLSRQADYLSPEFDSSHLEMNIHVPEGATPKDGPSAGITIVTSMISMLEKKPVPEDIGMTGEITLTGKVLPIGGLKEKLIAAKREHLKRIIIPKRNRPDYEELPLHIKKGLKMYFVEDYHEVHDIVFRKEKKQPAKRKSKPSKLSKKKTS